MVSHYRPGLALGVSGWQLNRWPMSSAVRAAAALVRQSARGMSIPAKKGSSAYIGLMLGQRLRRWPNINPA